jgi:hypothetical protein
VDVRGKDGRAMLELPSLSLEAKAMRCWDVEGRPAPTAAAGRDGSDSRGAAMDELSEKRRRGMDEGGPTAVGDGK